MSFSIFVDLFFKIPKIWKLKNTKKDQRFHNIIIFIFFYMQYSYVQVTFYFHKKMVNFETQFFPTKKLVSDIKSVSMR